MAHLIDKGRVVVEIENIKSIEFNEGTPSDTYACMALDMVKEAIDTLEVKEVDSKDEDFLKGYHQAIEDVCKYLQDNIDEGLVIYHEQTWRKRDEFINKLKKTIKE